MTSLEVTKKYESIVREVKNTRGNPYGLRKVLYRISTLSDSEIREFKKLKSLGSGFFNHVDFSRVPHEIFICPEIIINKALKSVENRVFQDWFVLYYYYNGDIHSESVEAKEVYWLL